MPQTTGAVSICVAAVLHCYLQKQTPAQPFVSTVKLFSSKTCRLDQESSSVSHFLLIAKLMVTFQGDLGLSPTLGLCLS